ncbi:uncharacterized protein LOC116010330 isoform X1 [Ipomoea triloba]|uniref:uncharacterized protein LOC116010330 isoform X1 n=2 Tax=Ipomoea triloba TaxID=35885 RepID=UPI00125D438E|nr:uncharacterized protein LOC116010330 isoform X1 [Ipomoea triloba]
MGFFSKSSWLVLHCWVFLVLSLRAQPNAASEVSIRFLKTPSPFSNQNSTKFVFQVLVGDNSSDVCKDCPTTCKLDDHVPSDCHGGMVSYAALQDGFHTFEACTNGSRGVGCASHNWTVDTVPPTAYLMASTSFTNATNITVNISFTEPCGFGCSSVNSCNLFVYGSGQVLPSTLRVIQPNLTYSVVVSLPTSSQFGKVTIVTDKSFCTDAAGNKFTRTENSSLVVHYDRRNVLVNLRTHIPERLLKINAKTRTVLATNNANKLKVYLYFTEPVVNSSTQILGSLNTSEGSLTPINGKSLGNRRFGFELKDISKTAILTVSFDSNSVISRQGTLVSYVGPVTFLYDSQRPTVRLSITSTMRTSEKQIPIVINFIKPVFGFNSSLISISGGQVKSFQEISRSTYGLFLQADGDLVSISVPENVTEDVAGNRNLPSNILQLKHYSVPMISRVLSIFATTAFAVTAFVAGLLTISTASLQSIGAFSRPTSLLTSEPTRSVFRMASHIQIFAMSRWLPVVLPVEYYEFARGLQWSVPYFNLPWETEQMQQFMVGSSTPSGNSYSSKIHDSGLFHGVKPDLEHVGVDPTVYGLPLTPMEYGSVFESHNVLPEADFIWDPQNSNGWREFDRTMFWLALIFGSLLLLHALLLCILKFRKDTKKKWSYGALIFPRLEIFLLILALPGVCKSSVALIKGGMCSGIIVGILLLGIVSFLLLGLFLFLSVGITCGKLLQYKEVHQVGQKFHWYQELVRVTLGPGKRGQWTWKEERDSTYLTIFGPLFEDLRGPPKYMLSQIAGGNLSKRRDRIIASDDETEDAEAPFIQKVFGILRIYYTFLDAAKRVALGIVAGAYLKNWSSRTPTILMLSIAAFQLFFMVLKKPFIKKKVQLVEILSVTSEVGIFTMCTVLLDWQFSARDETRIGIFMLALCIIALLAEMANEWYALYRQVKRLDPADNSFCVGLKAASIGFLLFFFPHRLIKKLDTKCSLFKRGGGEGESTETTTTPSLDKSRSTTDTRNSGEKSWVRQIRELAKSSFSREGSPADPSTSRTGTRWSDFWNSKRSGSSSVDSSADAKTKPRGLYKDLEAIFASK